MGFISSGTLRNQASDVKYKPLDTGWTQADIKRRNCEWDLNPVHLDQESVVFPLDHSLFLIKLHLTLIITLRMYTGWTQADIKRRNCVGFEPSTSGPRECSISTRPLTLLNQTASDVNNNP